MANVRIEQSNAHLARNVILENIQTSTGPKAKALMTVISNSRRGSGEEAHDVPTAIQWTLWGMQAENAAKYLSKGSHVNVRGRMENNNYEREGETVYAFNFTAEDIDYLDTRAVSEALRSRGSEGQPSGKPAGRTAAAGMPSKAQRSNSAAPTGGNDDDIAF